MDFQSYWLGSQWRSTQSRHVKIIAWVLVVGQLQWLLPSSRYLRNTQVCRPITLFSISQSDLSPRASAVRWLRCRITHATMDIMNVLWNALWAVPATKRKYTRGHAYDTWVHSVPRFLSLTILVCIQTYFHMNFPCRNWGVSSHNKHSHRLWFAAKSSQVKLSFLPTLFLYSRIVLLKHRWK